MTSSYKEFEDRWGERARLAWDTLSMKPTQGIPAWLIHVMDRPFIEQMTGHAPGDFDKDPDGVYLAFQEWAGVCYIDQYLADNVLTMGPAGYDDTRERTATTGATAIVADGIHIDSPEAVIEHMERFVFPRRASELAAFDPEDPKRIEQFVSAESALQQKMGANILKGPYADGFQNFPILPYETYGYENYFMAYALYPEVMEKDFSQQADLAALQNQAAANAILAGGLPKLIRLDHDMADSRSTLVDVTSLDKIWFPHFARAVKPFLDAGVRLIWHCDGDLMEMVPRLIEVGVSGFQGFQYEHGMDYEKICRMTDRQGEPLFIIAGVSVTRTLPFGTPQDVAKELKWLVENGPERGLMLGGSSSIVPGTRQENIKALTQGLHYYQEHGREG